MKKTAKNFIRFAYKHNKNSKTKPWRIRELLFERNICYTLYPEIAERQGKNEGTELIRVKRPPPVFKITDSFSDTFTSETGTYDKSWFD